MSGTSIILVEAFHQLLPCTLSLTFNNIHASHYSIYPGDVRAFLHAASDAILKADPGNPIAGVIGRGCMASTKMPFEWQIAHAPEDMRTNRVKRWRYKMCGTARDYTARESQYLIHLGHQGLPDPRQGKRTFHNQGHQQRKRSNLEMDVGQNIGPNLKRQDTGSSQWGSESQSSFSSPEHSRAPSVAGWNQPIMGPPPPLGPGQPGGYIEHPFRHEQSRRGSRGSQGSTSSGVSHAGSRMASLTFQSPFEGSSEGMGPPPEGSPWGGPHGVTRTVPGQPAGGFEAQAPFHGYQGPGQVHHAPVYGQPTEVFGYMRTDFQGPPQREFQVGIQHTQQFGAYAGGNPQHPGLQHQDMPPQPPPALSNIDPAQLLAPQTTLPPVGQNYPSSSPPATHPMPAELTHSPEHEDVPESSGSDSESDGEDDRSSYQHAAATQPLLDTGGQDRGRFYASPGAEAQPTYRDPYMGAGESDDE